MLHKRDKDSTFFANMGFSTTFFHFSYCSKNRTILYFSFKLHSLMIYKTAILGDLLFIWMPSILQCLFKTVCLISYCFG